MPDRSPSQEAPTLMVMAKGFRVSVDTSEFQLVWPPSHTSLTDDAERRLATSDVWPTVLKALYCLPRHELTMLECVLLSKASTTAVAVAGARDRFSRPMVVAASVTRRISWGNQGSHVGSAVSQCVAFARYAADQLAVKFDSNPKDVEQELRSETLGLEFPSPPGPESSVFKTWEAAIHAAKEWQGISGVASPPLLPLGANVVLGTEHEAIRLAGTGGIAVAGFYDRNSHRIVPVSENLSRWPRAWRPHVPVETTVESPPAAAETTESDESTFQRSQDSAPKPTSATGDNARSMEPSLSSIEESLATIAENWTRFVDGVLEYLRVRGEKKKRK